MTVTLWIAEAENGQIIFDSPPSRSDVRNACMDMDGDITVYAVDMIETKREWYDVLKESER